MIFSVLFPKIYCEQLRVHICSHTHTDEPSWPHFSSKTDQPTNPASFKSREITSPVPPRLFFAFFVLQGRNRWDEAKIQDHVTPNWAAQRGWLGGGLLSIFYFHPNPWGNDSIWRAYFSSGLKPPTTVDGPGALIVAIFESFRFTVFLWNNVDGSGIRRKVTTWDPPHLDCISREILAMLVYRSAMCAWFFAPSLDFFPKFDRLKFIHSWGETMGDFVKDEPKPGSSKGCLMDDKGCL